MDAIFRDGSSLDIERVDSQDSGLYRCNAKNILGEVLSDPVDVNVTPSGKMTMMIVMMFVFVFAFSRFFERLLHPYRM